MKDELKQENAETRKGVSRLAASYLETKFGGDGDCVDEFTQYYQGPLDDGGPNPGGGYFQELHRQYC